MKNKIIFLFLVFIFSGFIAAQSNTLKGKVTDTISNFSIQGAVVFILYNYMTFTNGDGDYSINELNEGTYEIKISCLGYKSLSTTIEFDSTSTTKDFVLEPSLIELDEVVVSTNRTEDYLRNSPFC